MAWQGLWRDTVLMELMFDILQNEKSLEMSCGDHFSQSVVSDSVTPWTAACQASLSITNSQSLFKLMSISLVMPSYHLILCHPLLLLPSIFPSIRVFPLSQPFTSGGRSFGVSALAPSNKYEGLDLLAIQGILKSLPQTTVQ